MRENEGIHDNNLQLRSVKASFLTRAIPGFHFYAMEILLRIHSISFTPGYPIYHVTLLETNG